MTLETKWTIDVVWVDWDFDSTNYDVSSWLHTDQNWSYGTAFAYDGPALSREADAQYTYTFQGWNQMHIEQIADKPIIVFKAVYAEKKNQYTITFVLGNGQPDVKLTQDWGTAVAAPANLNKEGYTFLKWDADVPETMPTSDMTITALWSINKYTIKFVDEDGTVLQSGLLDHGTMPTAPADPNKAEDDAYTYVFNSWDRVIVVATEDATYTATYTPTEKTCVITYVAGQGGTVTLNGADNWLAEASETVPVKTGTPVGATAKPDTGYKFAGWYAGDTRVSENVNFVPGKTDDPYAAATYTARFELAVVDLTIKVDDPQGDESYIFTVTGNPSDGSEFNPVQVVLTKDNDYTVTIKDVPVGIYTVHEEDGWSWRQNAVDDQTFLLDKAATGTFKFEKVDRIYWLSGESYNKRKKGVNSNG